MDAEFWIWRGISERNSEYQIIELENFHGLIRIPMRIQLMFEWALRWSF